MMKSTILMLSVMLLASAVPAAAGELYVKSLNAKVYTMATLKSGVVAVVPRGTKLKELEDKGKWVRVEVGNKAGWVSKYVVSDTPPMARVSLLAKGDSLEKSSRRRASAFTSVAAARGLTDYDRTRKARRNYEVDFAALEKMEKLTIAENEAVKFIESGVGR